MNISAYLPTICRTPPLTHNLDTLLLLLSEHGMDVAKFAGLTDLTPYAVEFRYEAAGEDARRLDMHALRTDVEALVGKVRRTLESNARH